MAGLAEFADTMRHWGTSPEERERRFACDEAFPDANTFYTRGVSVAAPAAIVFRWLCQLRAAPYSYDWIDNFGRKSPQSWTPGLDALEVGQRVMSVFELVGFELVGSERDRHLTIRTRGSRPIWVSYEVVPEGPGDCRLLAKLALRLGPGLRDGFVRRFLPFGDWIMMRRQLLNLKRLSERSVA